MDFIIFGCIAYILGSIPTAVWVGKSKYNIDVREHGSKNAGATNTFRILGKKAGIVVLSVDILKGALAVLVPFLFLNLAWSDHHLMHLKIVAGIIAVVGHIFPVFAQFDGGKGVATSLGVIIGISPVAALLCIAIFAVVFFISNFVSLGAIITSFSYPILIYFIYHNENKTLTIFSIFLAIVVISLHHKNIKRLLDGNESKMRLFKQKINTDNEL